MTASDVFLDSNVLVKLYLQEPDSLQARQLAATIRGEALVSELSDVEVYSVLAKRLPLSEARRAIRNYVQDRSSVYGFVALSGNVFSRANWVAELYAGPYSLRSLDILHLATALQYGVPSIASFDRRLRAAAQALGLAVLPA